MKFVASIEVRCMHAGTVNDAGGCTCVCVCERERERERKIGRPYFAVVHGHSKQGVRH